MLSTLYIIGFCTAIISLCIWTLTAGKTALGKLSPWLVAVGLVAYTVALIVTPKVLMIKLMLIFRDLGFIALCSVVIYFARWNKILAAGLILLLAIALAIWIVPVLAISI